MRPLRQFLDSIAPSFHKGGALERLYPVYEAIDTFLYTPGHVTSGASHVRDNLDLKRMMITVPVALGPCILMAFYNTGLQANLALQAIGQESIDGWRGLVMAALGICYHPDSIISNFILGGLFFVPIFLVANIAGGLCEATFSIIRKHEINEGFLVTGMLYPLTLPPNIPLWQVALGIIFGVVIGKEVFGGTGKNFLNPALTARAFLYFAYPIDIAGDAVWTAVDAYSEPTSLAVAAVGGVEALEANLSISEAFMGTMAGSLGETSFLACLMGAGVLIATGIGAWRTMAGMTLGAVATASLLYCIGSDSNPMFSIGPMWHLLLGSFAFGAVFMVTDPVSSAMTKLGRWIYGALVGVMTIVVRSLNPAYPEGVMLAILFGNLMAPLIDYYVVQANIRLRARGYAGHRLSRRAS